MKQGNLQNSEFRKYLLYAVGEMFLLVIGILIALQIDNWNSDKQQQEALQGYFQTIARNIDSDLASINDLRAERLRAYELSVRWGNFHPRDRDYRVNEVMLASDVVGDASTLRHFNASSSGYEALKSSGILDQMQGTDIEKLLFDYYDTVARIATTEQDHNELSRLLSLQALARWPQELEQWELSSAIVLTADRFESLQPFYQEVLQDNTLQQLLYRPASTGPLLHDYDRLDRLGRAFRHLVSNKSVTLDETAASILDGIHDSRGAVGAANVITDGQVQWHNFYLTASDAKDPRLSNDAFEALTTERPFDADSFQHRGDSLHINYLGGASWAGLWFMAGTSPSDRQSPDYSMYSKLLLEVKGNSDGAKIIVNMEDRDDLPDGSSTRYEIELSDEWQTFEIDLNEFKTADLQILSVPLGFVFLQEPVSFQIRTAEFIKAE